MNLNNLKQNNKAWVESKLAHSPDYFKKLAEGQSPDILYIGCSDSRVSPELIMGLEPGEVFVYRNVANLIPEDDPSSSAAIHFAVEQLGVKHIIVCGHYDCGGVLAAGSDDDLGHLEPWLAETRELFVCHDHKHNHDSDDDRHKELVALNVREQCANLKKIPIVAEALTDGKISVHGWVFDIETGLLIDLEV
jgi:carbonic anhydrase